MPTILIKNYLGRASIQIIPPSDSHDASKASQFKHECHIIVLKYKVLSSALTAHG